MENKAKRRFVQRNAGRGSADRGRTAGGGPAECARPSKGLLVLICLFRLLKQALHTAQPQGLAGFHSRPRLPQDMRNELEKMKKKGDENPPSGGGRPLFFVIFRFVKTENTSNIHIVFDFSIFD